MLYMLSLYQAAFLMYQFESIVGTLQGLQPSNHPRVHEIPPPNWGRLDKALGPGGDARGGSTPIMTNRFTNRFTHCEHL